MVQFGRVISCIILSENNRSRGFGFVTFQNHRDAVAACEVDHYFGNKKAGCKLTVPNRDAKKAFQDKNSRKIYIKTRHSKVKLDYDEIWYTFEEFGELEEVSILKDSSHRSGFVLFRDSEAVKYLMDNPEIPYRGSFISCEPCVSKKEIQKKKKGPTLNDTFQESRQSEGHPRSPQEPWLPQRDGDERQLEQISPSEAYPPTANRRSGGRAKAPGIDTNPKARGGVKPNYQIEINKDPQESPKLKLHNQTAADPMMLFVQRPGPVSEHRRPSCEEEVLSWELQEVNSDNQMLHPQKKQCRHRGSDVLNANEVYWNKGQTSNPGSDQYQRFQNSSLEDFAGREEQDPGSSNLQSDKSVGSKSSNTKRELLSSKGIGRELIEENIKINLGAGQGPLPAIAAQPPSRTSPTGKRNSVHLSPPKDYFLNSPALSTRSAVNPEGGGLLRVMPARLSGFSKQRSSDNVPQN